MRMHSLTAVVAGLAVVGTTGCATKGYVSRVVDERSGWLMRGLEPWRYALPTSSGWHRTR